MPVYYYLPENDRPSWGAGMIYYHVWLLSKNNVEAYVLHDKKPYKLTWLQLDVHFSYLDDPSLKFSLKDVLIIPEFYADLVQLQKINCKKIVFIQNAFYIFDGLKNGKRYEDVGISSIFYYMPHLKKVLQQITTLPLYETPPFIAPYYFSALSHNRSKRIILYPKFDNRDFNILKRMLEDKLQLKESKGLQKLFSRNNDWQLVELKNKKHTEVAAEMQTAAFFVSLNTTEAFNSSVPEAMAAGCINICYEGFGPADFLENGTNAYVFNNNHIYPLVDTIIDLVSRYDQLQEELTTIRINARKTAERYTLADLEHCLIPLLKPVLSAVVES